MDKIIPIWFEPKHKQGMLIPKENGMSDYHDLSVLEITGIRIYEEQYIGQTYQQIIVEYVNGMWVK